MSERSDFPCPFTSEPCQSNTCGQTWCGKELDLVSRLEFIDAELERHVEAGDALVAAINTPGADLRPAIELWETARQ